MGLFLLNKSEGNLFITSGEPIGRTAYSAIVPALPYEAPEPGYSGSIRITSLPELSILSAILRPITPPPNTTISVFSI